MLAFSLVHVNASPSDAVAHTLTDGACDPFAPGVEVMGAWVAVAGSHDGITGAHSRVEPGPAVTNSLVECQAVPRALEWTKKAGYTGRERCCQAPLVINPVLDPWAFQAGLTLRFHPLYRHVARPAQPLDAQVQGPLRRQAAWADQRTHMADRRAMKGSAHA
jgi:ribonuclease HI